MGSRAALDICDFADVEVTVGLYDHSVSVQVYTATVCAK